MSTEENNKKYCPYCAITHNQLIEMIRPRAKMKTAGVIGNVITNNALIGDRPMIEFINRESKQEMKYYDCMCPKCNIIIFYGEKNF